MAASSDAPPAAAPGAAAAAATAAATTTTTTTTTTDDVNPRDFDGAVQTDDALPTRATLQAVAELPVLDRKGLAHPFRSLYAAPGRTLVVFVRHFFCGNCQEYLRVLSAALPAAALAGAATPTRIVVVGCGAPELIDMYAEAAACAYPVFADPTRRLYAALGLVSTLALGAAPRYMRHTSLWASSLRSVAQGLRVLPRGQALKGGNQRQVGGEFLFETRGEGGPGEATVTWCHRMKTTRDHAEVDELQAVLGLA